MDFIYIPTEFYKFLNGFSLLSPAFLHKVLKFVKLEGSNCVTHDILFKISKHNLAFVYQFIFFVVSSISGLKKMDFLIDNDVLKIMQIAKKANLNQAWVLKVIEKRRTNESLHLLLQENKLEMFILRFFDLVKTELGIESLRLKISQIIVLLKYNKALCIENKIYEKE